LFSKKVISKAAFKNKAWASLFEATRHLHHGIFPGKDSGLIITSLKDYSPFDRDQLSLAAASGVSRLSMLHQLSSYLYRS